MVKGRGCKDKGPKREGSNKSEYGGINGRYLPKEDKAKYQVYKLCLKDEAREERLKEVEKELKEQKKKPPEKPKRIS